MTRFVPMSLLSFAILAQTASAQVLAATPISVEHEQSFELNDGIVRSVAISPDGRIKE